ncbi:Bug family tripartite tricarboxylate transporter substrate binding protein [Ottowia thiooxydans]|uniref:Bug family tripartite tricarboxylate transporter substrate binding protein n=1 Tax=Ottowia thiooxydans TaxID=219182 RepID=UPI00040E7FEE|nr:tripartite tricarboxylate transporter substrate binding protein [Ottowia thiooxydans]
MPQVRPQAGPSRRLFVTGALASTVPAWAQTDTSNRPVSLVVPLAPGGIADITARPFAIPLAKELGSTVLVENRIGAGGAVGIAHVARQKPDGQNLLLALSSIVLIPESDRVSGRPPRYTMKQFSPIALLTADPTVLVVRADSPYRTIDDVMKDAKARPGMVSFSSSGIYGTTHICQSMLWQAAGVNLLHVPYNGGAPSLTALLGNQVALTAQAPGTVAPHLKSGAVRILGTWGAKRLSALPDVKTFREQGYDVEFYIWTGLFAPAGLSDTKLTQLRSAARKSVQDPQFMAAMSSMDTPIHHLEGAALESFLELDQQRLAAVVQKLGKLE